MQVTHMCVFVYLCVSKRINASLHSRRYLIYTHKRIHVWLQCVHVCMSKHTHTRVQKGHARADGAIGAGRWTRVSTHDAASWVLLFVCVCVRVCVYIYVYHVHISTFVRTCTCAHKSIHVQCSFLSLRLSIPLSSFLSPPSPPVYPPPFLQTHSPLSLLFLLLLSLSLSL